jgi:hypothetical protein
MQGILIEWDILAIVDWAYGRWGSLLSGDHGVVLPE